MVANLDESGTLKELSEKYQRLDDLKSERKYIDLQQRSDSDEVDALGEALVSSLK